MGGRSVFLLLLSRSLAVGLRVHTHARTHKREAEPAESGGRSWCGADRLTYSRVPRMTSSIDPAGPELGTSGTRVRGGGFLRRAD